MKPARQQVIGILLAPVVVFVVLSIPNLGSSQTPGTEHGSVRADMELLTDTEGVDFNDYLRHVYLAVKQNWFAVMPSSVQSGDQGTVSLQFKIMKDGSVPEEDPRRISVSGKEPLDRAAISSIRASNPFPRLPDKFKGPYIELRFTYCYNCPKSQAKTRTRTAADENRAPTSNR
jgi:TonB family protein